MDFAFRMDDDVRRRIDEAMREASRKQQKIIRKQNEELVVLNRLLQGIRKPNRDNHVNDDENNPDKSK